MKKTRILKKLVDLLLSFIILIVFSPILTVIIFVILIIEGRPIFYLSQRFISTTKLIKIIKFRTMQKEATSEKYQLNNRFMRNGFLDIPLDCEVYTPIGRILERTQIVEVLQTLNILMGDMSFVGNRPLPKLNTEILAQFSNWEQRFESPAGITGISQIAGKYDLQPEERLYLERMYSSIFSSPNGNILLCDLLILWKTLLVVLTGKYLGYDKSIELLIRCGADQQLPANTRKI